jgi:hypothetical protein
MVRVSGEGLNASLCLQKRLRFNNEHLDDEKGPKKKLMIASLCQQKELKLNKTVLKAMMLKGEM